VGFNIIGQYTCILTSNAQELTPYKIRKCFQSEPRCELKVRLDHFNTFPWAVVGFFKLVLGIEYEL
jgi:hypothetical protein